MADTKISQLPQRLVVEGTDEFASLAGGVNYRSPLASLISSGAREQVYLLDFIPASEHYAIYASTSTYDASDALDAAIASVTIGTGIYIGGPEIILPYGKLHFDRSINLKKTVHFKGHGVGQAGGQASVLEFAPDVHGIIVHRYNTYEGGIEAVPTTAADASTFRDFMMISLGGTIGHGFWCRARVFVQNVRINGFPENGVHLNATAGGVGLAEGNANNCHFSNMRITGCDGNGFYVQGPDTNACVFDHIDCSANRKHGIYDSSFLGNTWIAPHTNGNGFGCQVAHQGSRWYVKSEDAAALAGTTEPGTDPSVWGFYDGGDSHAIYPAWGYGNTYYHGRAFFMDSDSATVGVIVAPYVEGGQPPPSITNPWTIHGAQALGEEVEDTSNGAVFGSTHVTRNKVVGYPTEGIYPISMGTSGSADDILSFYAKGDNQYGMTMSWDFLNKTYNLRHARGNNALRVTTNLSTGITGGRSVPLLSGRAVFNPGFWLGDNGGVLSGARYMSNASAAPTSGEYAAGDVIWNNAPTAHEPPGWMCTTTGIVGLTAWAANTSYALNIVRTNGGSTYRVIAGTSAGSGGPTGTATSILDNTVCWDYQTVAPWTRTTSLALAQVGTPRYNGGPKLSGITDGTVYWAYHAGGGGTAWAANTTYAVAALATNGGNSYRCVRGGKSASSGGPTGFGNITDGTAVWRYLKVWRGSTVYALGDICHNDSAKIYKCTTAGTSASTGGPTGTGGTIADGTVVWTYHSATPATWLPTTAYVVDGCVKNNTSQYYQCVTAGTSAVANTYILVNEGQTSGVEGTGPLGTGEMTDGTCKWMREPRILGTVTWNDQTAYALGDVRTNVSLGGYSFVCTQAGISGANILWAANTVYAVGNKRRNGGTALIGNSYIVTAVTGAATSAASGGPTGTTPGVDITDNNVTWRYESPSNGPQGEGIVDASCVWACVPPWQASVRYEPDTFRVNDSGKCYKVIAGTSAASVGPTGAGGLDGTVLWDNPTPFAFTQLTSMSLQQQQTIATGAAFTLTPGASPHRTLHTGTMTADRLVTLSTTGAFAGLSYKVTRTSTGAFNLNVGSPTLKALAVNTWCEVTYDGTAWYLFAAGAL